MKYVKKNCPKNSESEQFAETEICNLSKNVAMATDGNKKHETVITYSA